MEIVLSTLFCILLHLVAAFQVHAVENTTSCGSARENGCCFGGFRKLFCRKKQGASCGSPLPAIRQSVEQIMTNQLLQELVAVELADEAASVIVIRDIGRILGEKIADDLVDGIVALLRQGAVDLGENPLHFVRIVRRYGEFNGVVVQNVRLLYTFSLSYTN